ncbi:MAG: UvrD-helicase domain-containing protein [Coriobacteriales bacterium]|nr:UvrD-helicase domain-containing protein [Coriobacteriales bacterium]
MLTEQAATQNAEDPIFAEEQAHLSEVHAKVAQLEHDTAQRLKENLKEVQEFKTSMDDELSADFDHDDFTMETYAAYAVMNNVVDSFNISVDLDTETLARLRIAYEKPYFAKVRLLFDKQPEPREIYLGSVGVQDERHRQLIVDWRSPVAETYYNQQTGPMSYWANGKEVHTVLELRRQFDVKRDKLKSYFDTTVAIEDPLLLSSLNHNRTAQLQAITATIQREQNAIVRHEDVPALLVRGVAGSGKTSVMLQRIAYLLFHQRETLRADHVYLITPNPVFERYIRGVLPDLGEKNPHTLRWEQLMERIGPGDRALGDEVSPEVLEQIDHAAKHIKLFQEDITDISVDGRVLLTLSQVWRTVEKYAKKVGIGPRLVNLVEDDLLEKLERRILQLSRTEGVHDEVLALDADEQDRIFAKPVVFVDEDEINDLAREYLEDVCKPAFSYIENAQWLKFDRIGMRILNKLSLTGAEWLYLKMALTGKVDTTTKYVMVDEVQDYTQTQLMVLARYFSKAHFLLLGDPHQAIYSSSAGFDQIKEVFTMARGGVTECKLMTSYRSSPEITSLFAKLLPEQERIEVSSVQRPGTEPHIAAFASADAYLNALVQEIKRLTAQEGLTAVITANRKRLQWLEKQLIQLMDEAIPVRIDEGGELPTHGAVLLDLKLAKGLEFDRVIIADAQAEEYGADDLSRRRLYTAISRATKEVSIVAQGELTPLLGL